MRTTLFVCAPVIALAAMAVACGPAPTAPGSGGGTSVRLTLSTGTPGVGQATYTSLPAQLGYWSDDGIDVTINQLAGSSAALQSVSSGQGDVTVAGTSTLMLADAKGADLRAYYTAITHSFQSPAVPEDSDIQSFRQLSGKTVGVQSLETGTIPIIKGLVQADGGDPGQVKFLPVGLGAEALAALEADRIDALGLWDDRYAEIENLGQPLRVLRDDTSDKLGFQVAVSANTTWLTEHREDAVAFARGVAKATVFAQENPEAAVRLHWQAYPDTKPVGVDERLALEQGVRALTARLENSGPVQDRWGLSTPEQVRAFRDLLVESGTVDESVDAATLWTDELIVDINDFDADAVREQAREWKP